MARTNWYKKFQDMDSIYDESGNIKDATQLGFKDQEELDNAINYARSKGWGSISKGNNNYTIYAKNKDANNKLIMSEADIPEKMKGLYTPEGYAVLGSIDTYNKQSNVREWNNNNRSIYNQSLITPLKESTTIKDSKLKIEEPKAQTPSFYNPTQSQNITNAYSGNTGRNSNYKSWMNGVSQDFNYGQVTQPENSFWTSNDVFNSINKYFGNLPGRQGISGTPYAEGVRSMKNTAQFIANHPELMNDRRAKSVDYLAMEAKRLGRNIGGYDNLKYTDLLNMFSPENYNQYSNLFSEGRYGNNYTDFYKRLYNLSASRNGMQRGELEDLFGKQYDQVLRNIAKDLKIEGYQQGGILRMLFI